MECKFLMEYVTFLQYFVIMISLKRSSRFFELNTDFNHSIKVNIFKQNSVHYYRQCFAIFRTDS